MITITKQITLNPGAGETGPYTYTWSADTPSAGCVSFSPSTTGVISNASSQSIITDIKFLNVTCLADTTITLTITYNGGECTKQFPITITDPCEDFDVTLSSTTLDNYIITAVPTNGTGPFTYTWAWDEDDFTYAGASNTNVLKLLYTGTTVPPAISKVFCTVTDTKGCSKTSSIEFATCDLSFEPQKVQLTCNPDGTKSAVVCLDPQGCATSLINWNSFTSNVASVDLELLPYGNIGGVNLACYAGGGRRVKISVDANQYPYGGSVGFYAYVSTTTGITAPIQFNITVPGCITPLVNPISIEQQPPFQIDCTYIVTDIYYIGPISDFVNVYQGGILDPTSFEFIDLTSGTATGVTGTTALGATVTFNPSTLNIEYEIPALTGTDSFMWTICDTSGNCAQSTIYAIILDCLLSPTAVADSECAVCGETSEHDVLTNDTINGVLYNLAISSAPTHGSASFNGDFSSPRILYTPNSTYSGSDSYDYTLTNDSGESDTATVTVNVLCAGTDSEISVCE